MPFATRGARGPTTAGAAVPAPAPRAEQRRRHIRKDARLRFDFCASLLFANPRECRPNLVHLVLEKPFVCAKNLVPPLVQGLHRDNGAD